MNLVFKNNYFNPDPALKIYLRKRARCYKDHSVRVTNVELKKIILNLFFTTNKIDFGKE
jgi:hypothetical protein